MGSMREMHFLKSRNSHRHIQSHDLRLINTSRSSFKILPSHTEGTNLVIWRFILNVLESKEWVNYEDLLTYRLCWTPSMSPHSHLWCLWKEKHELAHEMKQKNIRRLAMWKREGCRWIICYSDHLVQGLANYDPWAKSSLLPVFLYSLWSKSGFYSF